MIEKPTSPRTPDPDSAEYNIAVMIARSRFGAGVDAGGAHNPRPSEWRMAADIVDMVRREAATAMPSLDPEKLARADHEWSRANLNVRCTAHYVPVRPCTPEDHREWAEAMLARLDEGSV